MSSEQAVKNNGTVTGILSRITPYQNRAGDAMSRIDVVIPSNSPMDHPITVSVHTHKPYSGQIEKEINVSYHAKTFLTRGSGKGSETYFDSTRLFEI